MKLKICGMTRQEDLDCAVMAGFDFCGFIFHAGSPRHVAPNEAGKLQSGRMTRVGVFVEQEAQQIEDIMAEAGLHLAQLHGSQTVDAAKRIGPERVIRVLWPERYAMLDEFAADAERYADSCAWYLLDAGKKGGGSGRGIELGMLKQIRLPRPWFLAGGLGPHNLDAFLSICQPDGLDFNSGLESLPGIKDKTRMLAAAKALAGRKL